MGQQDGGREGLRDIVVPALQQGRDFVRGIRPPCDEDDRHIRGFADLGAHIEAGLPREVQIQQDEVRREGGDLSGDMIEPCQRRDAVQGAL